MYYANESHLVTNNPRHHYIDSSCFMQMAHVLLNVGLLRKQWCALTVFRGRVKIAPKKKKKSTSLYLYGLSLGAFASLYFYSFATYGISFWLWKMFEVGKMRPTGPISVEWNLKGLKWTPVSQNFRNT